MAAGHRACAARSVLDRREHDGTLIADGRRCPRYRHLKTSENLTQKRRHIRHVNPPDAINPAKHAPFKRAFSPPLTAVALRATEQPVDTGTAAGKAFLDMLGVFAEFETNLRRERQLEGIALAKTNGVYKGRKPSIDAAEVRRLRDEEKLRPAAIARRLGIGRTSVYRALRPQKQPA